ncbi:GNAT family N-acetyltransferase [Luteococcus peritonei]|uniref:GNAT family N-acetyltransferase n=1 Tax=Luteococcus peritonei TaxID=88874 RepID=A0ABW4RTW0_9ACTN
MTDFVFGATIRPARPEDLAMVRELVVRSLRDDHGYGYRPDWHADVDDLQGRYLDPPRARLLVAEQDGTVVGCIAVTPEPPRCPRQIQHRYADTEHVGQLMRLVVDPRVRRQGIAAQLVRAALQAARQAGGYRVLALHTNARNANSVGFWRTSGAVEVMDETLVSPADAEYLAVHFEFALGG